MYHTDEENTFNSCYGDLADAGDMALQHMAEDKPSLRQIIRNAKEDLFNSTTRALEGIWQTKDGRIIKITKLGDCHLNNIINLIQSKNWYSSYKTVSYLLQPLLDELKARKESTNDTQETNG